MRFLLVTAVLAAGFAIPSASSAQTTIFLMFDGVCPTGTPCPEPRIMQVDVERPAIVATWPIACAGVDLRVTADGRFLLWNEVCGSTLGLLRGRDLVTGGTFALGPAPRSITAHPSRLQLLWPQGTSVVTLTPGGVGVLPGGCANGQFSLSGDGSRYAHLQACNMATPTYVIRSTASGAVAGAVVVTDTVGSVLLDERGDTLFALTGTVGAYQHVRRFAVATGLETATRVSAGDSIQGLGKLALDRRTGRVFATTNSLVEVIEPAALALARSYNAGSIFSPPPVLHPLRSLAFTIAPVWDPALLWIADPAQSTTVAPVPLGPDHLRSVAVAPHLPPPVSLAAIVAGGRVTLSWADGPRSAMAAGYDIEVAETAGGPPLLTLPVTTAGFVADGVPPGTYHVRVRARNHAGTSAPSAELAVVVP